MSEPRQEHKAMMLVPVLLLEQVLHIPEGHMITGAMWDFETNSIRLCVTGPDLPKVQSGGSLQYVTLIHSTETTERIIGGEWA